MTRKMLPNTLQKESKKSHDRGRESDLTPKSMEEDRGASDTRNINFTMVFLMICEIANHFDNGSAKDQGRIG